MSKSPFMPLWVSDFLGDTMDLDATEIGAYMLLLMAQWNRDGDSLPDDPEKLKRICRCGRNWPKVWGVIERFFSTDEKGVYSKRLRLEAQNVAAKREVNSHNGALGGKAKSLKSKEPAVASATVSLERNSGIPEPYRDSEDKSSGKMPEPEPQAKSITALIWASGVKLLMEGGRSDGQARSIIGKWRKVQTDEVILSALSKAQREGALDPVAFVEGCFRQAKKADQSYDFWTGPQLN